MASSLVFRVAKEAEEEKLSPTSDEMKNEESSYVGNSRCPRMTFDETVVL